MYKLSQKEIKNVLITISKLVYKNDLTTLVASC